MFEEASHFYSFLLDGKASPISGSVSFINGHHSFESGHNSLSFEFLQKNDGDRPILKVTKSTGAVQMTSNKAADVLTCENPSTSMYCIEMAPFLRLINAKNVDAIKSGAIQRPDLSATGCIQNCKFQRKKVRMQNWL